MILVYGCAIHEHDVMGSRGACVLVVAVLIDRNMFTVPVITPELSAGAPSGVD
jgi:hypothetical protein